MAVSLLVHEDRIAKATFNTLGISIEDGGGSGQDMYLVCSVLNTVNPPYIGKMAKSK